MGRSLIGRAAFGIPRRLRRSHIFARGGATHTRTDYFPDGQVRPARCCWRWFAHGGMVRCFGDVRHLVRHLVSAGISELLVGPEGLSERGNGVDAVDNAVQRCLTTLQMGRSRTAWGCPDAGP